MDTETGNTWKKNEKEQSKKKEQKGKKDNICKKERKIV
jgi:hypothetical protein